MWILLFSKKKTFYPCTIIWWVSYENREAWDPTKLCMMDRSVTKTHFWTASKFQNYHSPNFDLNLVPWKLNKDTTQCNDLFTQVFAVIGKVLLAIWPKRKSGKNSKTDLFASDLWVNWNEKIEHVLRQICKIKR